MIDYQLKDKIALITGVSRKKGIGAAICLGLAEVGVHVFTTYFRPYDQTMSWGSVEQEAVEIIQEVKSRGVNATGIEKDLRDPEAPAEIFDAAEKSLGPIDILVNNAATGIEGDVFNLTPDLLDEAYAINLRASLLLCSEFAKRHDGRPGGRVIMLTSGQGEQPMPEEIPYIATKGGLEAFTKSASVTLAKKGITINAIDPGATDSGWMPKELYEKIKNTNPMGRVGLPQDAARLAVFLASAEAKWITGQVIQSNGGGC